MAGSKLHVFILLSFLFALIFAQIRADATSDEVTVGSDGSEACRIELDRLASKIQPLETLIHKKSDELRTKDEIVAGKEKAITSLKVEKLQLELDLNTRLMEAFETRSKALEKILEITPKLQHLQQIIEEQKTELHKTAWDLKVAEEELMKTKNEATQKIKELTELHSAWLPPWLAAYLSSSQAHWNEHGKPALDTFAQKALEKKEQAEKWTELHIETIKTKWIPAAKEQWVMGITNVEPHVQLLTKRAKELYVQSKEVLTPLVININDFVDPHFQVAKKFCKPYIDPIALATKPHIDKTWEIMKPYTNKAVQAYAKFLESATKYHHQVQGIVEESLKEHGITRSLPTKEFVWFAASAFLALPIIILFRALSAIFFTRNSRPSQSRRQAKRDAFRRVVKQQVNRLVLP